MATSMEPFLCILGVSQSQVRPTKSAERVYTNILDCTINSIFQRLANTNFCSNVYKLTRHVSWFLVLEHRWLHKSTNYMITLDYYDCLVMAAYIPVIVICFGNLPRLHENRLVLNIISTFQKIYIVMVRIIIYETEVYI